MNNYNRKTAFTIVEIVVSMMVVAGIAMILVPVVLNDTKGQIYKASLTKFYTQLQQVSQSIGYLEAQGKISLGMSPIDAFYAATRETMKASMVLESNYGKYTDGYSPDLETALTITTPAKANAANPINPIALKNGMFVIKSGDYIVVDVNGKSSPNKIGDDIFYFAVEKNNMNGSISIIPRRAGGTCEKNCSTPKTCRITCASVVLSENLD